MCSANLCRSPTAAELLGRHLARRGIDAVVRSAGRGPGGHEPPPQALSALGGLGVDLSAHRSVTLAPALLESADLIVGMAREHVRDALAIDADVWPRTFTLKELVRRGEAVGARRPDEDLSAWLGRVGAARSPTAMLGAAAADDVADPVGGPPRAYKATVKELDGLTARLAALLD